MTKSLVLTGMMGVGKSTVGKILSKKLKMKFIDIDSVIEGQENMTIEKIFQKKGEKLFREIEVKISLSQLSRDGVILALGGGAFMDSNIRNYILNNCASFWLDLDVTELLNRSNLLKKRPLLKSSDVKKTLMNMYNERKNIYKLANYRIKCKNETKFSIANNIAKIYETI